MSYICRVVYKKNVFCWKWNNIAMFERFEGHPITVKCFEIIFRCIITWKTATKKCILYNMVTLILYVTLVMISYWFQPLPTYLNNYQYYATLLLFPLNNIRADAVVDCAHLFTVVKYELKNVKDIWFCDQKWHKTVFHSWSLVQSVCHNKQTQTYSFSQPWMKYEMHTLSFCLACLSAECICSLPFVFFLLQNEVLAGTSLSVASFPPLQV